MIMKSLAYTTPQSTHYSCTLKSSELISGSKSCLFLNSISLNPLTGIVKIKKIFKWPLILHTSIFPTKEFPCIFLQLLYHPSSYSLIIIRHFEIISHKVHTCVHLQMCTRMATSLNPEQHQQASYPNIHSEHYENPTGKM